HGPEATGSRGSGALPAFVDTILELRRYEAAHRQDRRRVLTGYGRWDETPDGLVVELRPDGSGYVAHGGREEVVQGELLRAIVGPLPNDPPGLTSDEIHANWPTEPPPHNQKLLAELRRGCQAGDWKREGTGRKGSPFKYWVEAPG